MPDVISSPRKNDLLRRAFEAADVSGDALICEFGVWKARSLNFIAGLTNRTIYGFDSFEGLPETVADHWKVGDFRLTKLPKVRGNVVLVKGWFDQTLPQFLEEHPGSVAFVHIDSDLYSSCRIIFDLLEDRLRPGTVICFDDYFNYPGWQDGEAKAFREFIERTGLNFEFIGYNRNGEQVAVKLMPATQP